MTPFEFIFPLFGLLIGLSYAEVLGGLGGFAGMFDASALEFYHFYRISITDRVAEPVAGPREETAMTDTHYRKPGWFRGFGITPEQRTLRRKTSP